MAFWIVFVVIAGFILYRIVDAALTRKKFLKNYINKKDLSNGKLTKDAFESIKELAQFIDNNDHIDNITKQDLDFDLFFEKANACQSNLGENYLYHIMTKPETEDKVLKDRNLMIDKFIRDREISAKIAHIFSYIGIDRYKKSARYIFSDMEKAIPVNNIFLFQSVLAILSIPLAFFIEKGFVLTIGVFIWNMLTYYREKSIFSAHFLAVDEMLKMFAVAKKISKLNVDNSKMKENATRDIKRLNKKMKLMTTFMYQTEDFIVEYLKILFLAEFVSYRHFSKLLVKEREVFKNLYLYIGYIDAMNSLSSYFMNRDDAILPVFISNSNKISFEDLYHPLIDNPVANSLEIEKSILLTGSNASGKSTFLRTIGLNQLLAQTVYRVFAKEYKCDFYTIISSMTLTDSIMSNESYYLKEIKTVFNMFEQIEKKEKVLCLIDEVLRGTNTIERIAASTQLLLSIDKKGAICIGATHDVELTDLLAGIFDNYHFQESIVDGELVFDYLLKEGKCETRNAIALLKMVGFEDEITDRAKNMADLFEKTQRWQLA